jgi:hypothetical protein
MSKRTKKATLGYVIERDGHLLRVGCGFIRDEIQAARWVPVEVASFEKGDPSCVAFFEARFFEADQLEGEAKHYGGRVVEVTCEVNLGGWDPGGELGA